MRTFCSFSSGRYLQANRWVFFSFNPIKIEPKQLILFIIVIFVHQKTSIWTITVLHTVPSFFSVYNLDEWQSQQYDVICALNLIDRCDKPMSLLREIRQALKPDTGRLLLAVVVPYKPYVEFGKIFNFWSMFIYSYISW